MFLTVSSDVANVISYGSGHPIMKHVGGHIDQFDKIVCVGTERFESGFLGRPTHEMQAAYKGDF